MIRWPGLLLLGAAMFAGTAATHESDGRLGMLLNGHYECELPGRPGGALRVPAPDASFTVTSSSRYIAADGSLGTYLRTGRIVTMTSGPLAGIKLLIVRPAFLRRLGGEGQPSQLRCVLSRSAESG
jgi:hypothetical protein